MFLLYYSGANFNRKPSNYLNILYFYEILILYVGSRKNNKNIFFEIQVFKFINSSGKAFVGSEKQRKLLRVGGYARWQATQWPSSISRRDGISFWQFSTPMGHRGWKLHPGGRAIGLGISPLRIIRSREASTIGSGIGTAERSAMV